jgi:polyisoprenoid-binding protein YceI
MGLLLTASVWREFTNRQLFPEDGCIVNGRWRMMVAKSIIHHESREVKQPMSWQIDLAHSNVTFSVKHMMVTTVRGSLKISDGTLDFDPEHPDRSRVAVQLDAASIDTGAEGRDAHLRSADFLDVEAFPTIEFRSTRVERHGADYRIHGELTLHGETRPVTLEAEYAGVVPNLQGGRRAAFSATTRINREEFGLRWNVALEQGGWLVGKELKIEIDLAAVEPAEEVEVAERKSA